MNMRSMRLWPLLFVLAGCQAEDSQLESINENLRNDGGISLIRNTIPTADRLPNLPVNPAYFVITSDLKDDGSTGFLAYPVNCEESEADKVLNAFGLSKANPLITGFGLNDLKKRFEADKQPVLNCSAIQASVDQRQVSAVFRLQDIEGQPARQNPSYYLKFQGFPDQLFQVGCLDILNSFAAGSGESVNFAKKAIPLADAHVLHYLDQDVPASDFGNEVKGDKGIRRLPCRASGLALPQPAPLTLQTKEVEFGAEARLLRVETGSDRYYVYAWKGGSRRVECPGASEGDFLRAFDFKADNTAMTVQPSDPAVLNADQLEPLRCVNPLFPPNFSVGFRVIDIKPEQYAFKSSRESSELFTFGCAAAEKFFIGDTIKKEAMIPISSQALDLLLSHPNLSKPTQYVDRVHVACDGSKLPSDPKALQDGEVISLKLPSASADKAWLQGNTLTSEVKQIATQPTGSFWLVESAAEEGAFHLLNLGASPSLSYLACPAQGNAPRLVKAANENGFQTKWVAYQGDGAGTLRLGCTDGSGQVRFLNGGGAATLLSEEKTSADAATNWWVQHQTFVQDSSLLVPGQIVSMYSLLTPQDNRWLAAYPGQNFDVGLEVNDSSSATHFQVESRKDGHGVSLKSLNSGNGDRYLECKPEEGKRWFELAPASDSYLGTKFKAYKLTNSNSPIFKLACFDDSNKEFWTSLSGKFPWLRVDWPASKSDQYSIMYLKVQPGNPTTPGAEPRREKIPRIDFKMENNCSYDFDTVILSYDTEWTTKTVTIRSKKSHTFPVQNQYTYYLTSGNFSGEKSDVQVKFQGSWQKSYEFNHRYTKKPDGSSSFYNKLTFCP